MVSTSSVMGGLGVFILKNKVPSMFSLQAQDSTNKLHLDFDNFALTR